MKSMAQRRETAWYSVGRPSDGEAVHVIPTRMSWSSSLRSHGLVAGLLLGCTGDPPAQAAASGASPTAAASTAAPAASATSSAAPAGLQAYRAEGDGFSALMLTPVAVRPTEDGTKVFSAQRPDGSAFTVVCPLRQQTAAPGMELLGFKEGILKGAQIAEERAVVVDGADGFEVSATKDKSGKRYRLDVRVLGKPRRMCAFVAATPDGIDHQADTRAFLESARVLD